jgi:hypothetical protein
MGGSGKLGKVDATTVLASVAVFSV